MNEQLATTTNLLHPRQVSELNETKARLEGILSAPSFVRNQLQDGGALVAKQLRELDQMLEQAPTPIGASEIDDAVKLERELRNRWSGSDMPTKAEMRRNAPGCVDKNMAWERHHKKDVLRWKHIRRRLHASGISEHRQADEGDISNVEMFRPDGGSAELSMDNAQIPGKIMKLPPAGAGPASVMSDEDAAVLAEINPELLGQMAILDNEQRAEVLALVRKMSQLAEAGEAQVAPSRSEPSQAQASARVKSSERMKGINARRRAKKAAEGG